MFTPYLIKDTEVVDKDGEKQTLKIGYIGVVPPQIMGWDKANLSGKVTVNDITETVRKKHVLKCARKVPMSLSFWRIPGCLPIRIK